MLPLEKEVISYFFGGGTFFAQIKPFLGNEGPPPPFSSEVLVALNALPPIEEGPSVNEIGEPFEMGAFHL